MAVATATERADQAAAANAVDPLLRGNDGSLKQAADAMYRLIDSAESVIPDSRDDQAQPHDPATGRFVARNPDNSAGPAQPGAAGAATAPPTGGTPEEGAEPGEAEPGQDDESALAIEPPASWPADLHETFRALPADQQQRIADWEEKRSRDFHAARRETTEADRRELAQAKEAVTATTQRYASVLDSLRPPLVAEYQRLAAVDLDKLFAEDPASAVQHKHQLDKIGGQLGALKAEQDKLADEAAKAEEARIVEGQRAAHAMFQRRFAADFATPEKASASYQALGTYLTDPRNFEADEQPFAHAEVLRLADPRLFRLAMKAMKYDALVRKTAATQRAAAIPAVKPAPAAVLKPGARQQVNGAGNERQTALMKRLHATGSVDDAARLLETLL